MFFRIAAVTLMVTASLAQAQKPAANAGIMSEVSNAQMHAILQGMGFEFTEKKTDHSYVFVFQLGGYKVTLLNQGADMQLYSGFSDKISLSKINGWNQEYRFGRAYVNDEGGGSLEDDLNFAGGVTKDAIEAFIKQYRTTLTTFVKFLNENAKSDPATPKASSPASPDTKTQTARLEVKIPNSDFTVSIDGTKWKQTKSDESGVFLFANDNGEGYAKIISERIALPLDTLRNAALTNMRKSDPNAKVVMEEKRMVNGKPVIALQVNLTTSNIPFRFYGYCYSGSSGSLQIWTFTAANVFDSNVAAFTEFLNGFTSSDQPLPDQPPTAATPAGAPAAGMLSLIGGKMSLQYDPKKWLQRPIEEQGRFRFAHVAGDGYALVISERIGVDMEALPDIALTNAKSADPNAKIVVREKRKVNGVDVWYLQIDAIVDKIPFVYNGYYYTNESGTVQILTYTGKNLIGDYKTDFLEFLNGFRANP